MIGPDAQQQLDAMRADVQRRQQGQRAAREELAGFAVAATSADEQVTVEVRDGAVAAVLIEDGAYRLGPDRLAEVILATIQQAMARYAVERARRVQQLYTPRLDVAALVEKYQPADPAGSRHG